jgi:hypothetical protein
MQNIFSLFWKPFASEGSFCLNCKVCEGEMLDVSFIDHAVDEAQSIRGQRRCTVRPEPLTTCGSAEVNNMVSVFLACTL